MAGRAAVALGRRSARVLGPSRRLLHGAIQRKILSYIDPLENLVVKAKIDVDDLRTPLDEYLENPRAAYGSESLLKSRRRELVHADPLSIVRSELDDLTDDIKSFINNDHPVLSTVAKYFFDASGKRVRPAIVLLIGKATSLCDRDLSKGSGSADSDSAIESSSIPPEGSVSVSQRKLAEITEMIHTASIVHDDVIDSSSTRRGIGSINYLFGNKVAVLAGDFLLARASIGLARLRDTDVIEMLSTVIEHLVEGEIMQMKAPNAEDAASFEYYLRKTFLKTASLISLSSRASAMLENHRPEIADIAFAYGKHLGLAYQIVDDVLDYTSSSSVLGKPALADLELGIATAPVLFAMEEFPELRDMAIRKFTKDGDVERAHELVTKSHGIARAQLLAASHCQKAAESIMQLPHSPARDALVDLTTMALLRDK